MTTSPNGHPGAATDHGKLRSAMLTTHGLSRTDRGIAAVTRSGSIPTQQVQHYLCPDCHRRLTETGSGHNSQVYFSCVLGHQFSLTSLLEAHAEAKDAALWDAMMSLEHEALCVERAMHQAIISGTAVDVEALQEQASAARDFCQSIRARIALRRNGPRPLGSTGISRLQGARTE